MSHNIILYECPSFERRKASYSVGAGDVERSEVLYKIFDAEKFNNGCSGSGEYLAIDFDDAMKAYRKAVDLTAPTDILDFLAKILRLTTSGEPFLLNFN